MSTKCGANHQVRKLQITAMNCHFCGYFRELKWLRINLNRIQWWSLISKVVTLN
ncbi:hypothetical protein Hanom_Chr04g00323951 [Helianthus anomalus]